MMNISLSVSKIINRYGCDIVIDENGKNRSAKAFLQPLRHSNEHYAGSKRHLSGRKNLSSYLLFCTPDVSIKAGSTVIQTQNRKYIVKRCETYYVTDSPVYVWAVLEQYGEALEDDYEPN